MRTMEDVAPLNNGDDELLWDGGMRRGWLHTDQETYSDHSNGLGT